MSDPRLVAALAAALDEAWVTEDGGDSEQFAVAVLPAFLADPRTHEWLVERVGLALIVRLRAALDGLVDDFVDELPELPDDHIIEWETTLGALRRAALAAAKEGGPQDIDGLPFCPSGYAQRYHAIGQCACGYIAKAKETE